MPAVQFALQFMKLAVLDQLGAQLGLPAHADRAPAVIVLVTLMLQAARQAVMDPSWISDSPARSSAAGS